MNNVCLPRRLLYAWDEAVISQFPEADAAYAEIPHKAVLAAAAEATSNNPRRELRFLVRARYYGSLCHNAVKYLGIALKNRGRCLRKQKSSEKALFGYPIRWLKWCQICLE
jgi:hypothetical protein